MRLVKFTYHDDGNEAGLGVEFRDKYMNPNRRHAVVMNKYGKQYTPLEVANALRQLARWCEALDYNTERR